MRLGSNFRPVFTFALGFAAIALMTATTPTPSPAPEAAPPPKATPLPAGTSAESAMSTPVAIKEPAPIKNKVNEFSTRTDVGSCSENSKKCSIDTYLVAKALDNAELDWERRLFFRTYEFKKDTPPPVIKVKSLKFVGKKMVHVTNDRGDVYEVEIKRGHMKKPKKPREYSR